MRRNRGSVPGFTLIELMLVVAIIGLLAAIAVPKFGNLVTKAKEASVRGKLGTLRSALSLYYADNEGYYGDGGTGIGFLIGKYMDEMPSIELNHHHPGASGARPNLLALADIGWTQGYAWVYGAPGLGIPNPLYGTIWVQCTHTDSKGVTWSMW